MRLAQFVDENGRRALAVTARGESRRVKGARTTLDLVRQALYLTPPPPSPPVVRTLRGVFPGEMELR